MKYSFKPLNNLHLYGVYMYYMFLASFFDICFIFVFLYKFDIQAFVACIIINTLPLIIYISVRIMYPYKYVINDEYLVKYKRNKVIFKIKIKDIKEVVVKKANILNFFKFIISLITYYNLSTKNLTTMSFVFEKCEVLDDLGIKEFKREEVVENKQPNEKEYVEILPYGIIKEICKIINIEYKIK